MHGGKNETFINVPAPLFIRATGIFFAQLFFLAGAMRLPGGVNHPDDRPHFLTHGYIDKFGLATKEFPNFDVNGLSNIYGLKAKTSGTYVQYIIPC